MRFSRKLIHAVEAVLDDQIRAGRTGLQRLVSGEPKR